VIHGETLTDFNEEGEEEDEDNPFNPGFGASPPELAGRAAVLAQLARAFKTGPRDPWYITALIGDRGVGKTAVLNEVEKRARKQGWTVVHEQVVAGQSLLRPLLEDLINEAGSTWSRAKRALREFDVEASLGVNVGVASANVKASRRVAGASTTSQLTRDVLRVIGRHAQDSGTGVLITIDEVQEWSSASELGALAAALQLVSKREGLPVAVIFAGLPVSREVLSCAGTFFERITYEGLEDLSKESTEVAFVKPANSRGISIDPTALDRLVSGSAGYPYLIQLAGRFAWPPIGAPRVITDERAVRGITLGRLALSQLFASRWEKCSQMQKAYLRAVAGAGGSATTTQIGAALARSTNQLGPHRHALIHKHHLLDARGYGEVAISLPGFGQWILEQGDAGIPPLRTGG
jgi:hypothetical protein